MKSIDAEELVKTIREKREEAFKWKANANNEEDRIKASSMITAFTDIIIYVLENAKEEDKK